MAKSFSLDAEYLADVAASSTADTEFSVAHNLERVPVEAFVLQRWSNGNVYRGNTAWSTTLIYLKASVANLTFNLLIV